VQSDLFFKNGRNFNKGAAINAGFDYFQYHGWRMHIDSDIILPDNFKRVLFNHSYLERHCLYGADRYNVIGNENIKKLLKSSANQHHHGLLVGETENDAMIGHRLVDNLRGYLPLGFFQLWHASTQKPYPYSLGNASHDDMMFSALWPLHSRRHLPSVICYHLCPSIPKIGENWDGIRKQAKLKI
jgi:glycosyltransferase involved in cell wall biosynthesis